MKFLINKWSIYRFLWAELQLKAICAQVSDYGIEQTLRYIPKDIDATYERILEIIDKKPPAQRELARKALSFVAYARESISINTLALAIATEDDTQSLDMLRSSISTETIILNACGNLLSVDNTDSRHVHFIHFSAHEFLTNHQSRFIHTLSLGHEAAHREIARMCMIFLLIMYSQIDDGDSSTDTESSFATYIFSAFPHHLLAGNLNSLLPNDEMITLTRLFFGIGHPLLAPCDESFFKMMTTTNYFTFSPSVLALIFHLPGEYQCYNPQVLYEKDLDLKALRWITRGNQSMRTYFVGDDRLAMHYATGVLDSVTVCQRLHTHGYPIEYTSHSSDRLSNTESFTFNEPDEYVSSPGVCRLTPLYLVKGEEVARFLLDRGASVNPQVLHDKLPNLLGRVTKDGNTKVIQLLLDRGAAQEEKAQGSALESLAQGGKVEAIRLLLDNWADVNTECGIFGDALIAAACNGNTEVIQLLLDKGANVNAQNGKYGNFLGGAYIDALQAAVHHDKIEAIQLLLDKGANVNAQGGEYGNSLQTAAHYGNVKVVKLLLDKGGNVNAQGGYYGNALQAASMRKVEAMLLLLDKGADIHAQGGYYGNALQAAAASGNIEAMQLLLDKGAGVNVQGGEYGYALHAAAVCGHVETMQLLLEKGADVNARGGKYGNPLQAAAYMSTGNIKAMQLLLDKGANVNAQGGEYGNSLQAAAHYGNVKVVKFLLAKGADVNAQGGFYGNALQAAAYRHNGTLEIMRLLLDNGANVHAQGGRYGNALQAASIGHFGVVEAMRLLLDKGADIHAQGGEYGNALQAAAICGNIEAMQFLLDKGADVNAQGGYYGYPLQAAAAYDKVEAVQFLLEKGADIHARGGFHGSALQAVDDNDCYEVKWFLQEKTADLQDEIADLQPQSGGGYWDRFMGYSRMLQEIFGITGGEREVV